MINIHITKPFFDENERNAVAEVLKDGWIVQGPKVQEFEKIFAEYVGVKYAVAVSSCTAALHLALVSLGIKSGDEVIVPSFTYVATANAVEYTGAKPVFVDIDLNTYNIDSNQIKRAVTKRTKAIIPVHLFGLSADMDAILGIAKKYGLYIIEDAACAVGSLYKGKHVGAFGNVGCFSFHPRKIITTGEGGMLATNDKRLAEKFESLRSHGATISDLIRHRQGGFILPPFEKLGYNYRMTDIQAAIGIEQVKKLNLILKERMDKADYYNRMLSDLDKIILPMPSEDYQHSYQSYVVLLKRYKDLSRNQLADSLIQNGIAARQGTHAVHMLGYYRKKYKLKINQLPNSLTADRFTFTLPLYKGLSIEEQDFVIKTLKTFLFDNDA